MAKEYKPKFNKDSKKPLIAKRDFTICWNDYLRKIKKGDDVSDVPQMFHQNLKTEKVI